MKLSIIIPVYNEETTIGQVIDRVLKVPLPGIKKEVIVVNDGSTDQSKRRILEARVRNDGIKSFESIINLGKGAAIRIGLTKATGDLVIIQDADLELDPQEYRKILQPIIDGKTKVVYGSRFLGGQNRVPPKTRLANWLLTNLTNLLYGSRLTDMETAYKAFRTKVIKGIRLRAIEFEFEPEITARILKKGVSILEVPIQYRPRTRTEGKKISLKDGVEAIYTLLRCKFF